MKLKTTLFGLILGLSVFAVDFHSAKGLYDAGTMPADSTELGAQTVWVGNYNKASGNVPMLLIFYFEGEDTYLVFKDNNGEPIDAHLIAGAKNHMANFKQYYSSIEQDDDENAYDRQNKEFTYTWQGHPKHINAGLTEIRKVAGQDGKIALAIKQICQQDRCDDGTRKGDVQYYGYFSERKDIGVPVPNGRQ